METTTHLALTAWEAKERTSLLALETPKWRAKRLLAQNPDAPAPVLSGLWDDIVETLHEAKNWENMPYLPDHGADFQGFHFLSEVLFAHPNIPTRPPFYGIIGDGGPTYAYAELPLVAQGICRNPLLPFWTLENPAFWEFPFLGLVNRLLNREALSPALVKWLTHHTNQRIRQTAQLHISQAGELAPSEGMPALTEHFRRWSEETRRSQAWKENAVRWRHTGMLAKPLSATYPTEGDGAYSPPVRAYQMAVLEGAAPQTVLAVFDAGGNGMYYKEHYDARDKMLKFLRYDWVFRLNEALAMPLSDTPFPNDEWGRSPLLLLKHHARDGNRFVRWAARTRLEDPDFKFTWNMDSETKERHTV